MGLSSLATLLPSPLVFSNDGPPVKKLDKIEGSWFEFQHHSFDETKYWNADLLKFTAGQWDDKIREIAETGMRFLVLLDVAAYGKSFYPSGLMPIFEMGCDDPLEAVLAAADKYGIKFFVSNDYFGNWRDSQEMMTDPNVASLRRQGVEEVASKYAHHDSFFGWYYPNETGIHGHYEDFFIKYVNDCSAEIAKVTPNLKTLIAPYGTRNIEYGDRFVQQLDQLDVDYIAYQDEIGVEKTKVEESAAIFERLQKMHHKSGRSELWADVEVFQFSGDVYRSEAVSAQSERVIGQLEAVAPFVEKILIYQYIGLINKPGSGSFAGRPQTAKLYEDLLAAGWFDHVNQESRTTKHGTKH
jgi:hypothetical protein